MDNEWILDVIADLRTFARQNGLQGLAGQLDRTWYLAASEIAVTDKDARTHECGPAPTAGSDFEAGRSGFGIR